MLPVMLRHLSLAAALVAATLIQAEPAQACGATPCAQLFDVLPADGARAVPTNTEVRVQYFGFLDGYEPECQPDLKPLRLIPRGGVPVELTGTAYLPRSSSELWIVARPGALAPNTEYSLQIPAEECSCTAPIEWRTISTFVTGAADDEIAPEFAGLTALGYDAQQPIGDGCGTLSGIPIRPELEAATDQGQDVRYNLYIDGTLAKPYLEDLRGEGGYQVLFVNCGDYPPQLRVSIPPGGRLEARAVDLAGNESEPNRALAIQVSCSDPDSAGAVSNPSSEPERTDASSALNDELPIETPVARAERSVTCAVSHQPSTAGGAILPGLLLALLSLLHARRARSPR